MSIFSVALECGENSTWLALPATAEEFNKALHVIGGLDKPYTIGEYVTSTDAPHEVLFDIVVSGNINEVNFMAARLASQTQEELDILAAVMETPGAISTIADVIDYTYNPEFHALLPGVKNTEDLAQHYIFDSGFVKMPEHWKSGIDLYAFGVHLEAQSLGVHTTKGFLFPTGEKWIDVFEAINVPSEYRLVNYLATAEKGAEQNYNQIDGIINNEAPRREDAAEGREPEKPAQAALVKQPPLSKKKPSILGDLKAAVAGIAKPGPAKDRKPKDIDL